MDIRNVAYIEQGQWTFGVGLSSSVESLERGDAESTWHKYDNTRFKKAGLKPKMARI